ncbi:MAG TPA: DUF1287 domain-containing protein [Blastocatellia bacterium]|nr:DUF1287 domain-containing protein [Blastocatellia bacterium]
MKALSPLLRSSVARYPQPTKHAPRNTPGREFPGHEFATVREGIRVDARPVLFPVTLGILLVTLLAACASRAGEKRATIETLTRKPASTNPQINKLVDSAIEQTQYTFSYDASYVRLDYPGGDVPRDRGVCADVIVRAFRAAGVDLQKEVHEDMAKHFGSYPDRWGARKPDKNIDHRRVPNLMTFFERLGRSVPISKSASDYLPGDVVAWELDNHLLHIGIVSDAVAAQTQAYLVVHNIGSGAKIEDVVLSWKIIGHYRMWK